MDDRVRVIGEDGSQMVFSKNASNQIQVDICDEYGHEWTHVMTPRQADNFRETLGPIVHVH
jgi:hypothetical protein